MKGAEEDEKERLGIEKVIGKMGVPEGVRKVWVILAVGIDLGDQRVEIEGCIKYRW